MPFPQMGAIVLGKETTYGTQSSSIDVFYPFFEERITSSNRIEGVNLIAQNLEYSKYFTGDFEARGDVVFPIYYNLGGKILYAFFGSVNSAQQGTSSAYKHTFTFGSEIPSYSFWINRVTSKFIYTGGVINSLNITLSRRETPVRLSTNWIFSKEAQFSGTDPTISIPTEKIFIRKGTSFKLNNVQNDYCKGITINLDRNIDIEDAKTLTSGRFLAEPVSGAPNVTGTITFRFKSMNEWKAFWGSTTATEPQDEVSGVSLYVGVLGDLIESTYYNKLEFEIYNAVLTRREGGTLQGTGGIEVTYNWEAHYDTTAGTKMKVFLTNTATSYP